MNSSVFPAAGTLVATVSTFSRGPERVQPAYLRDNVALTLVEQQALRDSKR